MATFEMYRASMIGRCLIETLNEMVASNKLDHWDAYRVLLQFDESIAEALKTLVKNEVKFTGDLSSYRYCDDVWTFNLQNVVFNIKNEESHQQEEVSHVKIVACDSRLLLL